MSAAGRAKIAAAARKRWAKFHSQGKRRLKNESLNESSRRDAVFHYASARLGDSECSGHYEMRYALGLPANFTGGREATGHI
jgi:hypothetical protein